MNNYSIHEFPKSRIATIDVGAVGKQKHHMCALLECDVTESRLKIKALKSRGNVISFTGWLLKTICSTLKDHSQAAAFLSGRKRIIIFNDVNVSILVEKSLEGSRVPIPLVIEQADKKSMQEITKEIESAKDEELNSRSIVLKKKTSLSESLYYYLPGFIRRYVWRFMLRHPRIVYKKMGNVAFTSVGMFGQVRGWFIHTSVHPLSFGVGSVVKKPEVINNEIKIREMLQLTVLIDHDVIDGAPMFRFIGELVKSIENGRELQMDS
ncbi:MAG: 2-oxo acid dehydrogenase subunit E2 [Ignavibacteria bacterium]|jgi:pyruvate/2-oxoglutarate dehydrogenase complex dihydrolipoamide acyltransferase (E2) component|nr:2-oxo acid dehydrogenase subunit E2 [Ignavibacteria bacterium]MCU7504276.1 2-oxo acid dehydrogenase subunit E2 [Ignavibacteria bacterium]MCU7516121.1 2-oxo acid dehydrogenase subunit E2 [Ignavibacteria bacterium]